MRKGLLHIVIVNAIYPPDNGASGRAVFQLAEQLEKNEYKITVVTTNQAYNTIVNTDIPSQNVIRVKARTQRNTYLKRLFSAYHDSKALLKKSASINADMFILCSDPPLMKFLAPRFLKNKKHLIWAMDLYPEAFVAKGLVSKQNWLVKGYEKRLALNTTVGIIALGKSQLQFLSNKYRFQENKQIVIPCGVHGIENKGKVIPTWKRKNRIILAYCGNLGEAHSAKFLLELICKSNPKKHQFVLSAFGTKVEWLHKKVSQLPNVSIVDWIQETEIHHVNIQIVSLKKEWTHVCVPSKAVSSICHHTPVLFHGSSEGDTYQHFQKALWHIPDDNSCSIAIEQFYASLQNENIASKKEEAILAEKSIKDIYQNGVKQLSKILSS